jgi:hypothetical protein
MAMINAIELRAGDIVMALSGEAHAVRNHRKSKTTSLDFLTSGEYVDAPPNLAVGRGAASAGREIESPLTRRSASALHSLRADDLIECGPRQYAAPATEGHW